MTELSHVAGTPPKAADERERATLYFAA